MEKLAASAVPPVSLQTEKAVKGGASLRTLWELPEPRERIAKDAYNVVVLQEDIPETTVASFRDYARKFVTEIRAAKARPVLLMAWSYPRLGWISTEEIARAHRDASRELGVEVAPVALAWRRSIEERAGLDLYAADREHPAIAGTYLATCVVYATVFGRSPRGLGYIPPGLSAEDAAYLQRIAWESVQDWKK